LRARSAAAGLVPVHDPRHRAAAVLRSARHHGTIRDHTCYIYVDDLQAWHRAFAAAKVGTLHPIEQKPWGVPEFVLVDVNGNTIRVGCPRLEM
jgi:hypothetical protein